MGGCRPRGSRQRERLVAGVMGMSFKVGLFQHPTLFLLVLALIIAIAPLTFAIAKLRDWI